MKMFKNLLKICAVLTISMLVNQAAIGQCETWTGKPNESEITDAHTIYRGHIKTEEFDEAFEFWQKAYEAAPAADGGRDFHYTDGIKIYKNKLEKATTDAEKEEAVAMILKLYDEVISCFESGAIKMKIPAEERVAYFLGRKAYDMYYTLRTPYSQTFPALEKAIEVGGMNTEYIVIAPYADVATYQFSNDKMDNVQARAIYDKIVELSDHNIKNNTKYGSYYKQAKESALGSFAPFEAQVFDCAYFIQKLEPEYRKDPDNPDVIKDMIQKLKRQGCTESDALVSELEGKWSKYAAAENTKRQAEFEANNPAMLAKKAYDAGDYNSAIAKYQEAISNASDPSKQAEYYFRIASIEGRKLKKYGDARRSALKAAELKPGYGRPYMLIGDLYASSSRNCGDNFMQRCAVLAAINKYSKAKSVDSSVADEANSRIAKYRDSKPSKDEAFMRGFKSGQTVKVECWIGEKVTLSF